MICLAAPPPSPAALVSAVARPPASAPQAMAVLHTEGTLPHHGLYDRSASATRDFSHMLDLALAWRADGHRAALDRLAGYFDAWTAIYRPSFNPIDETHFDGFIAAFRLSASTLPTATAQRVRAFLKTLALGYLDRIDDHRGQAQGVWGNNWQSHRVKLAVLAAAALDDPVLLGRARSAFVAQLSTNMRSGGEVLDFGERDALHYVVYDLEPLTVAALAAADRGEDWLHLPGREGQTLAAGLDWLVPYAQGAKPHQEFVHSSVRFDSQRAEAGLPGYSGLWEPKGAAALYWSASVLDPGYLAVARTLSPSPPRWLWAYAPACQTAG